MYQILISYGARFHAEAAQVKGCTEDVQAALGYLTMWREKGEAFSYALEK